MKGLDHDPDFRWRGQDVTRIENLSDIVFALALGMIISTGYPISTFVEMKNFLSSIIPVAAAFAILLQLWNQHFTFFRRYGVADKKIIFLNALLIFAILYIAYPLRFAFDSFYEFISSSITGDYSRMREKGINSFSSSGTILAFFGVGYAFVHVIYALMHQHVLKKHALLELSHSELQMTRQSVFSNWFIVFLASLMSGLANFTNLNGMAGFILALSGVGYWWALKKYPVSRDETLS